MKLIAYFCTFVNIVIAVTLMLNNDTKGLETCLCFSASVYSTQADTRTHSLPPTFFPLVYMRVHTLSLTHTQCSYKGFSKLVIKTAHIYENLFQTDCQVEALKPERHKGFMLEISRQRITIIIQGADTESFLK